MGNNPTELISFFYPKLLKGKVELGCSEDTMMLLTQLCVMHQCCLGQQVSYLTDHM